MASVECLGKKGLQRQFRTCGILKAWQRTSSNNPVFKKSILNVLILGVLIVSNLWNFHQAKPPLILDQCAVPPRSVCVNAVESSE
jgi:hypothetical protein